MDQNNDEGHPHKRKAGNTNIEETKNKQRKLVRI